VCKAMYANIVRCGMPKCTGLQAFDQRQVLQAVMRICNRSDKYLMSLNTRLLTSNREVDSLSLSSTEFSADQCQEGEGVGMAHRGVNLFSPLGYYI
jgi:hypothetical protein